MKTRLFCLYCREVLEVEFLEVKERQVCSKCREVHYENPLPVAAVILPNRRREILLVKRAKDPFKNMWCLPIGFAETGESIEEAALRELKEETGVEGSITQLVDVSSDKTFYYGELLVVTFEAEKIGGEEMAGDDALECSYFPVMNLPKLAFHSQGEVIQKFIALKKDLWNMHDSFESLVEGTIKEKIMYPDNLLSDELVNVVQNNSQKIIDLWLKDITTNPSTKAYHFFDQKDLFSKGMFIIGQFEVWLKGKKGESAYRDFYYSLGRQRKKEAIPIEDLVSSLSLLKKHIWMFTYSFGVWEKAVDMYRMFELSERLVYFFDKASYYTVMGYNQTRRLKKHI